MLTVNSETGQVDIAAPGPVNQQDQLDDLDLVLQGIDLLSEKFGEEFQPDLRTLSNSATAALDSANAVYDGRLEGATESNYVEPRPSEGVAVTTQALGGTTFTQNFFIKYRPGWWIYVDHSAVKIDVYYSGGSYIGYLSTRNHGLEADDPSMGSAYLCPRAFYNRPTTLPPIQPYVSSDTALSGDAGGCGTNYGLSSGQHVCNDDSLAMRDMAVNNAANYSHWTCSDSSTRAFAPSCY